MQALKKRRLLGDKAYFMASAVLAQQVAVRCLVLCPLDRFFSEIQQGYVLLDEFCRLNAYRNHCLASWMGNMILCDELQNLETTSSLRFLDTLNLKLIEACAAGMKCDSC